MTTHRILTRDELVAECRERFGEDPQTWAFVCPNCGDVAVASDFPEGSMQLGQYCVGNFTTDRGCDWKSFGLFPGPWEIVVPSADGEHKVPSFSLAEAPQ